MKTGPETVLFMPVRGKLFSLVYFRANDVLVFCFVPGDATRMKRSELEKKQVSEAICTLFPGNEAKLSGIRTKPKYQKIHLSRSLLIYVLHKLKELKVRRVHLRILKDRDTEKQLIGFYSSLGFVYLDDDVMVLRNLQKHAIPKMHIKGDAASFE